MGLISGLWNPAAISALAALGGSLIGARSIRLSTHNASTNGFDRRLLGCAPI